MRAHFGLPSVEKDELEGKPPITVKFEIPYFTVSGIQVCVCFPVGIFVSHVHHDVSLIYKTIILINNSNYYELYHV